MKMAMKRSSHLRFWFCCAVVALALVAAAIGRAETAANRIIILKAARLIDGRGGQAISPAAIRIEGEKITQAGTKVDEPAGAQIIDLGSATLLPGLIDLHTHLTNRM